MKGKLGMLLLVILLISLCTACGATPAPELVEVEKEVTRVVEEVVEKEVEVTRIVEGTPVVEMVVATPEPEAKGGKMGFAQRQEPDTLDPHRTSWAAAQHIMMNIYDSLFFMNPDTNELEPWLAESWEYSEDGKTWTFYLRNGVTFHDGTPFNAEAVKYNFDRLVSPEASSPFAASLVGPYESSEVVDDYTVRLHFSVAYAPLADGLSQSFLGMISPTAAEKWGIDDFGQHPVGTGPFMFKEWAAKDHVTLVRNPNYNWAPPFYNHQGPAYLEEIIWRFVEEPATRLAILETGEVHLIDLVPEEEVVRLATDPNFYVISAGCPGISEVLWFNTERPPTNELKIRQAINYATDRKAVSGAITFNVAPIAYGPISEATLCFDQDLKEDYPYPYDPEKAKALLEEAGWVEGPDGIRVRDGQRLELILTKQTVAGPYSELIQGMLREVGMEVTIEEFAPGAFVEADQRGEFHITAMGWISKDPVVMESTYHSKSIPTDGGAGWALHRFRDETLDQLVDESLITLDPKTRCPLIVQAQKILMENAVVGPLYDIVQTMGVRSELKDVRLSARSYYPLLFNAWVAE